MFSVPGRKVLQTILTTMVVNDKIDIKKSEKSRIFKDLNRDQNLGESDITPPQEKRRVRSDSILISEGCVAPLDAPNSGDEALATKV